jgi:PAS domain S-box-containing protein
VTSGVADPALSDERREASVDVASGAMDGHVVQFYVDDDELTTSVADFMGDGLAAGDVVAAIAVEAHGRAFRDRLQSRGLDVEGACARGQMVFLDATSTLSRFMRDDDPDPDLFDSVVGELMREAARRANGARVRAYGEMVDVLWRRGARKGAIRLEELWNELRDRHPFTLLCAYAMAGFYKEPEAANLVCRSHDHVVGKAWAGTPRARAAAQAAARSPQLAETLAREIVRREEIEQALRESLRDLRLKDGELRRSTEQLRDMLENAALGVHRVASDGMILWANRAELEMLGYAPEEYVGHPLSEFYVDLDVLRDLLGRLGRGEAVQEHEVQMRAKDGSTRHVLVSSNAYFENGEFVYTRCFTRDVTERRRLERFRAASVARSEQLVEITSAIADAVTTDEVLGAVVDRVARALDASSAALWLVSADDRTMKLSRAVGYGDAAHGALEEVPLDGPPALPVVDAIRRRQPIWIPSQEALLRDYPHLEGSVTPGRSYRVFCLPLVSQDRTLGGLGITIDEAREATEEERDFLLLVARYAGQALERLRVLDAERRSRAVADAAAARVEQLYHFAKAVVSAERAEEVFEAALCAIEGALRTNRGAILIYDDQQVMRFRASRGLSERYRRAVEGHSPWAPDAIDPQPVVVPDVQSDATMRAYLPLFAEEGIASLAFIPLVTRGSLIGKFMVYYDEPHAYSSNDIELALSIASHLASVTARFAAIAKLENTVRYNDLFAGVLAHDLRNPLGAMMTAGQLLLRRFEGSDDRNAKSVSRILSCGQRMARMIDELLDLTRVRVGGGMQVEPRQSNLEEVCGQAIDELELAHPGWNIQRQVVGDQTGRWDPDRLLQVVSNLVGNAGQHGRVDAPITVTLDGRSADSVTLTVQNQGDIPAELVPSLFDPFRGTRQNRDASRGLGLGLFIVKELVRAHGGRVDVASSPSTGTTFSVCLPRRAERRSGS